MNRSIYNPISLDYSDDESEPEAKTYLNNNSVRKLLWIEQHIRTLENPRKNTEFCRICNADLKSLIHAKTHYNSVKHVNNLEQLREKLLQTETLQENVVPKNCKITQSVACIDEDRFYCKICSVNLVGKLVIDKHLYDEGHKRNLEAYCDICQVRTTSKDALFEHKKFSSHLRKLEQLNIDDGPTIPLVCVSPKISSKKSPKVKDIVQSDSKKSSKVKDIVQSDLPYKTPQLEQNVTWNCDVCYKKFESESLFTSHKGVFSHIALEMLKINYTPELVDAVCTVSDDSTIICLLCDIKMRCLGDIKSHLNGIKHVKRFKTTFKQLLPEDNTINIDLNSLETDIKIKVDPLTDTNNEIGKEKKVEEQVEENITENNFCCYICKQQFNSKPELNAHAMSFPHVELAKLKSEAVSLGVPYAEYWLRYDNYFCCTLCNANIYSPSVWKQHMNCAKHRESLMEWSKEFSTWKCGPVVDPKYFYCKTCDLPLIGTSDAELHYNTEPHIRRLDLFCLICNVASSTEEMFQEHKKSIIHRGNILTGKEGTMNSKIAKLSKGNEDGKGKSQDCHSNNNLICTENKHSNRPSPDISLRKQIIVELQQLINTLYYSKSVPMDVALDCFKQVNKEINDLKQKYRKEGTCEEVSQNPVDVNVESQYRNHNNLELNRKVNIENVNDNKEVVSDAFNPLESNDIFTEQASSQISSNSFDWSLATNVPKPEKKRRKKKNSTENPIENKDAETTSDCNIEYRNIQKISEEENGPKLTTKESEIVLKNSTNFEDILQRITVRKKEVDKLPDEYNVEKDVLNEIETLIKLIDSDVIPLDVTLSCLRDCNKKLKQVTDE